MALFCHQSGRNRRYHSQPLRLLRGKAILIASVVNVTESSIARESIWRCPTMLA